MKNWKVIVSLVLFYPLGLYLMIKHTDWSERSKWIIGIIGSIIFAGVISDFYYQLIAFSGILISIASITWLILAQLRRKPKRSAVIALIFGAFISVYSIHSISEQTAEAERIAYELQVEEARVAEEERLEKELVAEEEKQIEQQKLEEKYLGLATSAVEKVEAEPTYTNYTKAVNSVKDLITSNSELENRLADVESVVEEYELSYSEAIEAIDLAEENMNRETYETAYSLSTVLIFKDEVINSRLSSIDKELTLIEDKAEEERLAQEAAEKEEAERMAQEKAAAEERKAAEQAESEKKAAEAAANSESNQSSGADTTVPPVQSSPPADDVTKVVYIAPQSGTKYHYNENCRGLSNANSVASLSINDAQAQGYTLCGWED